MIGQQILHYEIIEKLGSGGMGVVYKAEDTKLKRTVALKFLPPDLTRDEDAKQRFIHEAQTASALDHSNICAIHEIGETEEGQMFIAMAYYEGETLKKKIERGALPVDEALDLALQIAGGLSKAHEKGIIHRDIKPANVMVTSDGVAKIVDFGLAKAAGGTVLTKDNTTLGTVTYMSPEQTRGESVDKRTDIWALGVVLYEMLTGQLPFKGDYEQAIIYSILNEAPEPMADVAPEVEQIVLKTLVKNPDGRYQSADELIDELQAIRGEQSVKVKTVMKPAKLTWWIAVVIVMLIAVAFYLFRPASRPAPGKDIIKTIAVLPFVNMSSDPEQEYFSDGMSEELINVLAKNPKLRVTARTSSFFFKGKNVDIKTIATKLNVQHILEGSVRKSGNNLRISADLVNVENDATLWSDTYDGNLENIFALQDSISHSVDKALDVTLLGKEAIAPEQKTDPQAYNLYLLGNHFFRLRSIENLKKATGYYEQALSIDSNYAPAWVGLSQIHSTQANWGYVSVDEGYMKARHEVEKALKLNPNLAEAYSQMGNIKNNYDWDWIGANEAHRRALELEPGNAGIIDNAALLAFTLGQFKEAITLIKRSIELDPVRADGYIHVGMNAWYTGSLDESIAAFRKALDLNPQFQYIHSAIGLIYLEKGKPDSALVEIMKETDPFWQLWGLAIVYHALGKKKEADDVLELFIKENQFDGAKQIAEIYAYRGEKDKAFEWLERAYTQHDGGLVEMKCDPLLRNIEKDSRYAAFMKKMKLPL